MTKRRTFTDEFKRQAVALLESGQKPLAKVARELGVSAPVLRDWRVRYGRAGAVPAATVPTLTPRGHAAHLTIADMAAENARLQAEVRRLQMHSEILKKAIAVFSGDQA